MDFFAGSGSTGHAVLHLNAQKGDARSFVLVQLPEPVDDSTETGRNALALGMKSISAICEERMRRVIDKLDATSTSGQGQDANLTFDRGFRVFKLAASNFAAWEPFRSGDPIDLEKQLELHVEHIRGGRTDDDLLYELLLRSGFSLAATVETIDLAGKNVFSVADGALLLCLDRELNLELIRKIAEKGPERVVCLDAGFAGNDQLKANATQLFKTKGVASFKTV
jgi:adenine-specific DNA-methyltransferase